MESSHTLVQASRPAPEKPRGRIARHAEEAPPEGLVLGRYRLLERLGAGGFGVFVFQGINQTAIDLVLLGALPIVALGFSCAVLLDALVETINRTVR